MSAEILERANASTEQVLANISRDHLGLASPCASWKVRDVLNHVVGNNFWFALGTDQLAHGLTYLALVAILVATVAH